MKLLQSLVLMLGLAVSTQALTCWICENVPDNDACLRRGRAQMCQSNQEACQNEVRRGSFGILITKRCKQAHACDNNFIQNPRAAWFPSQCNSRTPSSVCRCCCASDLCNRDSIDCTEIQPRGPENDFCDPIQAPENGRKECILRDIVVPESDEVDVETECQFTCDEGYQLVGSPQSICDLDPETQRAEFNRPPPRCTPSQCSFSQVAPENGDVSCSNGNAISSVCRFECDQSYVLIGSPATICLDSGLWSTRAPRCQRVECVPPHADPLNGLVTCDNFNNVGSTCRFECFFGFFLEGFPSSLCQADRNDNTVARWTTEAPTCRPVICVEQVAPLNGNVVCTDGGNLESVCQFTCNSGFALIGNDVTMCFDDEDGDAQGEWTSPPPSCQPIKCNVQVAPANGRVFCTDSNNLDSVCQFSCNSDFVLVGNDVTECFDDGNNDAIGQWTSPPPECQQIVCPTLKAPANGNISCTNENLFASTCSFACDDTQGFALFPVEMTQSVCRRDGDWDRPIPCCARRCPPFAVMDLALVLDSSSSIGDGNWEIMTAFIRTFIESFEFSPDFSRLAVIRYNAQVDTNSQILFSSFVDDRDGLLAAYDAIPYDGSGTRTGQAIQYVSDVVLTEENGDRLDVQDVVIVITDGRAQDGELLISASEELRTHGAITYAIGIRPNSGRLDRAQLEEIGGGPENVFVAESGFEGLGELLQNQLSEEVCENRCGDEQ